MISKVFSILKPPLTKINDLWGWSHEDGLGEVKYGLRFPTAAYGMSKGAFLKAFGANIFFDNQRGHCESATQHVAAARVPHGISSETAERQT